MDKQNKEHQYKLAVVGLESSILLYKAIGAETFGVSEQAQAQSKVEELFKTDMGDELKTPVYAVIFVEESFYAELPQDVINRFTLRPLPAVIPVPSPVASEKSFAAERLSKIVEKAVGSDIFS